MVDYSKTLTEEELKVQPDFEAAVDNVTQLPQKPTDGEKLELYGLFKQVTVGDNTTDAPTGMFDFAGKAKWKAWNENKGKSTVEAMNAYVELVKKLEDKYGASN
ncbi:hypothetical protein IWW50_002593 [Coemansia erecta]|nr:hypothetical protein GGF43_005775 [Coemansia sp. RSA 2618]KAJ2825979.1 hypothetical protein IWW50_002593 [Coemansia erecta]